jgi:hypothetical protein
MHITARSLCTDYPHPRSGPRHIGRLTAPILDRLADCELQHGHVARAEQLAQLAADMREDGQ